MTCRCLIPINTLIVPVIYYWLFSPPFNSILKSKCLLFCNPAILIPYIIWIRIIILINNNIKKLWHVLAIWWKNVNRCIHQRLISNFFDIISKKFFFVWRLFHTEYYETQITYIGSFLHQLKNWQRDGKLADIKVLKIKNAFLQ